MEMFVFSGIVFQEDQEFTALCPQLNVATQGQTAREAKQMLLEAVALHMEGSFEDGLPYLRPIPPDEDTRAEVPEKIIEQFRFKVDIAIRAYA